MHQFQPYPVRLYDLTRGIPTPCMASRVVVKMAAGEHIRVARRNVIPISNEPVHLSQDLMDADFLDDVDDILMGAEPSKTLARLPRGCFV